MFSRSIELIHSPPDLMTSDRASLLDFYRSKTARWRIPDDVVFVDELPHTATGKPSKKTLRESFRDYAWPAPAVARGD